MGEANTRGNRFFDLSKLSEGIVIYKPNRKTRINLEVKIPVNWKKQLSELSDMVEAKAIAVSIRLLDNYICLTYDEEKLNGYSVDTVSRRKEISEIKKLNRPKDIETLMIKDVYKKYYDEQREKKLTDKIKGRCIAIDMNPTNIGYSVLDKTDDVNEVKIIEAGMIDLSYFAIKLNKKSSNWRQKWLNNKRKNEIYEVVKRLFKIAKHYKCSEFIIEDLVVGGDSKSEMGKESNRKIRNLWCRTILVNSITRRCNENGIELKLINPVYTSFIGNIKYGYVDSTNASIEIGRRGLNKYENGGFYPIIDSKDIVTLEAKFGSDAQCMTATNWADIYKSLRNQCKDGTDFAYRLRASLSDCKYSYDVISMCSYKSKIKCIIFNNLY